ncbi:odorant receptor 88a [Drosophila grimshawi]|uniref:Odorant receptor n=1 Tax=Drosophila grimshawi TaxID=7222 RepID=B4JEZ1_DROGR|nr:odorant receptor 88a [Drosophila grimshawi]EDV93272.1 GH18357 [Drosophila grimshawi]
MDAVNQPIEFEQFLQFIHYQEFFNLLHFKFARNENGRLFNKSDLFFYTTFLFADTVFLGGNAYDILKSLHLGEPSHQNPPMLTMGFYFVIRGVSLFIKRHDMIDFLNDLDKEFPRDLQEQMVVGVDVVFKQFQQRRKFLSLYFDMSLFLFCLAPPITYIITYEDRNAPILLEHQLIGGYLPFDLRQNHAIYPLVWIYDVYAVLVGVAFFNSFDTMFYGIHTQIIMHLDYLSRQFEAIDAEDSSTDWFYEHIFGLIRRQQQLNMICDKFNDIFKLAILMTDLVAAASLCFHLYLLTDVKDPGMIFKEVLVTLSLIAFTFDTCLRGTQLEDASARLNEAIYNQNWYMGSKKYRKLFLIWLKYTQCTKKITAYGLMDVNMTHFSDIMQLAYRLFTFLNSRQ